MIRACGQDEESSNEHRIVVWKLLGKHTFFRRPRLENHIDTDLRL
jgi:hypothetical protein